MKYALAFLILVVAPTLLVLLWAALTAPVVPPDYDGDSEPFPRKEDL